MNEGRDRGEWWHTASLQATIANSVRDPKKRRRAWRSDQFHPWEVRDARLRRRRESRSSKTDIRILKAVFVDGATMDEIEEDYGV